MFTLFDNTTICIYMHCNLIKLFCTRRTSYLPVFMYLSHVSSVYPTLSVTFSRSFPTYHPATPSHLSRCYKQLIRWGCILPVTGLAVEHWHFDNLSESISSSTCIAVTSCKGYECRSIALMYVFVCLFVRTWATTLYGNRRARKELLSLKSRLTWTSQPQS